MTSLIFNYSLQKSERAMKQFRGRFSKVVYKHRHKGKRHFQKKSVQLTTVKKTDT